MFCRMKSFATLSDTLLPKLFSGALSGADTEEVMHDLERQTV